MGDSLPSAADARHLSAALRRAGLLGGGRVRDVVIDHARTTVLSRIVRLRLSYDGAAVDAPRTVIFKTGLLNVPAHHGMPGARRWRFIPTSRRICRVSCHGVSTRCGMRKRTHGTLCSKISRTRM